MTEYKQKDNTTTLFENQNKPKETSPDLKGSIKITEAGEYWVSAWKGKTQKGDFKLSISLTKKENKQEHSQAKANGYVPEKEEVVENELDDSIPF